MGIEVKIYFPTVSLSKKDAIELVLRIPRDLELFSQIPFMTAGKQSENGIRNVYAIHRGGKVTGYRIEDIELLTNKFDPNNFFGYSEGLSRREITLEEMDKIAAKLEELRSNNHT